MMSVSKHRTAYWNKWAPGGAKDPKNDAVIQEELSALNDDANREMDLPEGEDWGDK